MFMNGESKQRLKQMLDENNGVLVASEAIHAGIPRNAVYNFASKCGLEKVSPGIFLDTDTFPDELYLLQTRYPKIVFSHETALYLHDMAEREPIPIVLTVESGYHADSLKKQGARILYVKPEWHGLGICEVESMGGHIVRAYDRERTICDIVRRRSAMDPAAYGYALRSYARSGEKNLVRLGQYATELGIERHVQQAMEVLL